MRIFKRAASFVAETRCPFTVGQFQNTYLQDYVVQFSFYIVTDLFRSTFLKN